MVGIVSLYKIYKSIPTIVNSVVNAYKGSFSILFEHLGRRDVLEPI